MPLTKLQFQPGINKETTSYSNEGGWFDILKKLVGGQRLELNLFLALVEPYMLGEQLL